MPQEVFPCAVAIKGGAIGETSSLLVMWASRQHHHCYLCCTGSAQRNETSAVITASRMQNKHNLRCFGRNCHTWEGLTHVFVFVFVLVKLIRAVASPYSRKPASSEPNGKGKGVFRATILSAPSVMDKQLM
jgi:hypothetical protein